MKMEQQNTNSKEGVEVLRQVPFEDEKLGKGQFTSKVYHLQRFVCNFFLDFFFKREMMWLLGLSFTEVCMYLIFRLKN
jgi:hypothetical protein